ncbi:undecaprenyl/decaprenyl-phosphate alpha-N-acetylglucosaminyl 1-phosphate transferase [Streptacidiphilus sp. 4-A2]|nr:undecaprenyl/decaprenyl-phosphate alpha-N-acetylglucosaminyl 1-phosphate transferase [Streptacidiphilus sp. 4-A2]
MREFLLTLCVTAAVTYLLTGPVRKFAIVAGAMPEIRERDVHREPTPRLGGIAMFGGLCAGLTVASRLPTFSGVFHGNSDVTALLAGAGLMWIIGVLDDKWGVDALVKLGGQMVAAGVMVYQGVTVFWLPVPGVGPVLMPPSWGTLLAVMLVVLSVNAVNFIDGLDGLAAGMVCIAGMAFFVYAYRLSYSYELTDAVPATLFSVILVGMCVGFLPHNLHPARIFMGDSGSMLIGLVLSVSMISLTGGVDPSALANDTSQTAATHAMVPVYIPLLLPLATLAIPLADLLIAVVRRTWAGKSPFAADRQHLHHRLLEIGHSHSRAVMIMYFWGALIAFATVAFSVSRTELYAVRIGMALCVLGIIFLLMPRFKPHAPRIAQRFLPPRYRRPDAVEPVAAGVVAGAAATAAESAAAPAATAGDTANAASAEGSAAAEARPERRDPAPALSHADEELLRRIGTGAHASGRHSGVSGQSGR